MNREDIIRMAREAGMAVTAPSRGYREHYHFAGYEYQLERFAALVAAAERNACLEMVGILVEAEREACAKVCDEVGNRDSDNHAWDAAAAIRARGQDGLR